MGHFAGVYRLRNISSQKKEIYIVKFCGRRREKRKTIL